MRKHKPLVEFIETHCQERAYSFQIKKCNQATYKIRYPIRMPIDIFLIQIILTNIIYELTFANLYGKSITEKFRSSPINMESKTRSAQSNVLVSAKIRDYTKCNSYGKTRCLYSDSRLTELKLGRVIHVWLVSVAMEIALRSYLQ
ncbi:hypothetical protein RirG_109830 [Rhizophagus irregularis DAOM 197198w]|uniref:Uncharacterized protein n=1 Tax=Rhizophagus irregularis (strain DAOM 197198w) TaxID=1432141 RepID=A0A015JEK6_RHIIW|nr:hypothetical protein RirG_109830 [Rhizophagus irregularis DAOM 197198w]